MVDVLKCNAGNATLGLCNTHQGSLNTLTGQVEYSAYGYIVYAWSAYAFLVAFALVTLIHTFVGIFKRELWVVLTLAAGAAVETAGWGGRLWSVQTRTWDENLGGQWEYNHSSFILQICGTVIAPTFFSAANYIILGKLINLTGGKYCILTSRSFAIIFMFSDFVCLVIQGAGGGIAGTANTDKGSNNGAYIMTGGVVVQLVVTVIFSILLLDFIRRYRSDKPVLDQKHWLPNWKCFGHRKSATDATASGSVGLQELPSASRADSYNSKDRDNYGETTGVQSISNRTVWVMISTLIITTLLIIIRSIYRSVELTNGWRGKVAVNQGLFLGADALLMILLIWIYVVVHPSLWLPKTRL